MDRNSFYRTELRCLFIQHGIEQNEELLNILAQMVGSYDRSINKASEAVNALVQRSIHEPITHADTESLQREIYTIFWKERLES